MSSQETVIDPPASERTNNALEDLFKDTPEVVQQEEEAPEPEPEPEPEVPEEEQEEQPEEEDQEVDYDADPSQKQEEEPLTESKAIEQAKLRGREAKELRTKLTEKELEAENLTKERDTLNARLQEIEATKINPTEHPDYIELRDSVLTDVRDAAELLPGDGGNFANNFGHLMGTYLSLPASGPERTTKLSELKGEIVDRLKLSDVPYAEMEDDEKKLYEASALEGLKVIQRNVSKTKEIQKLVSTLEDKAKNGHLAIGVKAYESTAQELTTAFSVVGDVPDDVLEASPYSMAAIVAKMVKENPEMEKRLKAAQKDALELIAGPRVYTQAEIDKLQANGINIKEHNAERLRLHKEKQKKLGVMFIEGVMTRADYARVKKELEELKAGKAAEESESDALLATTRKKAPKKEVDVYVPAAQRRNKALDEMLGEG